tara:strand:+ start:246 stop:509 length:264 start_codon:yes stop_codon:yes gene_type:complete
MTLTNRELAWQQRKAKSHPTYDMFGKYAGTLKERMAKVTTYYAFSPQRIKLEKKFNDKYGAWWIFQGVDNRVKYQDNWIEQFRKVGV